MKTKHFMAILSIFTITWLTLPAQAAVRIRPGQWVGTWTGGGRTRTTSSCMTQSDAGALNGDVKSVRGYLENVIPPAICKLKDIKVDGSQIIYTSVCGARAPNVVTTTYHGDSLESASSNGDKSEAKLTGGCK
jgi:hypothetical protein